VEEELSTKNAFLAQPNSLCFWRLKVSAFWYELPHLGLVPLYSCVHSGITWENKESLKKEAAREKGAWWFAAYESGQQLELRIVSEK
jgi:hypothetical protein